MAEVRPNDQRGGETLKIRALVVEDEESFLGVLIAVLRASMRFTVEPAETGEDAVEAMKKSPFDLVILDHQLPGMSGLNVLQWMYEQKLEIPVIVLTGTGSENIAVEMMKLGAYDYLPKDRFDQQHFPVFAAGVYERFLFRKGKEQSASFELERESSSQTFEMLHQSIYSLTQTANTALATARLVLDESESSIEGMSPSVTRDQLRRNCEEMKQEYETIAMVTKSLIELTRLMFDRFSASRFPHPSSLPGTPEVRDTVPEKLRTKKD